MLPWYTEFGRQYLAQPYGAEWKGNFTLLHAYEKAAYVLIMSDPYRRLPFAQIAGRRLSV